MGITNFENNILTLKMFIDNNEPGSVQVKRINTGSYIYNIIGYFVNGEIGYKIHKTRVNGQYIGKVGIDRISIHGMEYNKSVIGSLPDSVVIEIMRFHREILRRTGNYR